MLSPHLDDAVFSLGAHMHHEARRGVDVHVVTVLANDPHSEGPPSAWDARCGFASAAEAARARREEDRRACAIVGATPQWLPYGDETYGRGASGDEIWEATRTAVGDCALLLVPGFPLRHADHAWLADLVTRRADDLPYALGFYAEQPYAGIALADGAALTSPASLTFSRVATTVHDVYAKARASLQYRSQLRALGARVLVRAFASELRRRGELVALPPPRDQP